MGVKPTIKNLCWSCDMPQSYHALTRLLGAWLGMFAVVVVLLVIEGGLEDVDVHEGVTGVNPESSIT